MCTIHISPGQGGQDAELFAGSLADSILAWARAQGHGDCSRTSDKRQVVVTLPRVRVAELDWQSGQHRIQHHPESAGRGGRRAGSRQTSYATITVTEAAAGQQRKFSRGDKDVQVRVARATGPGGQGVNTTDSAVTIRHGGITVRSRDGRSQTENLHRGLQTLGERHAARQARQNAAVLAAERGSQAAQKLAFSHDYFRGRVTREATGQTWTPRDWERGRYGVVLGLEERAG